MRLNYLSDDWLEMVRSQAQILLDAPDQSGGDARFRMTQWAKDRSAGGGWTGFQLDVVDRAASIVGLDSAQPDADVAVSFPYDLGLILSRVPSGAEFDLIVSGALADGTLSIAGDPGRSPFPKHALHDAIVARTA